VEKNWKSWKVRINKITGKNGEIYMWKDEIRKGKKLYDGYFANKPALEKLHRAIVDYIETDDVNLEQYYDDKLTRELRSALKIIEAKLNY
jgi:hypothetical protein